MKHIIVKLLLILAMSGLAMAGSLSISTEEKEQLSEALAQIYDINGKSVISKLQVIKSFGKFETKDYILIYKMLKGKAGIFIFAEIKNPNSSISKIRQIDFRVGSSLVIDATLPAGLERIVYSGNPSKLPVNESIKVNLESDAYKNKNRLWIAGYAPKRFYDYDKGEYTELGSAKGNCTWYAQGRLIELGYNQSTANKFSGNANSWDATAINNNVSINDIPQVGSIAQKNTAYLGHVAIVEELLDNNKIRISESSYCPGCTNDDYEYKEEIVNIGYFDNYIHLVK